MEGQLKDPFVVVVSLETPDGGKPGVMTEVARLTAARQIVEGRARVSTDGEAREFRLKNHEARVAAERALAATKVQVVLMPAEKAEKDTKE